ncbi:hypothetical protein PsYK624_107510 [Phanerochaete sordida]|uniref:Uncharacterized protein n=1 Tax=Phanerochaete sordida TaxID=48140 RepID=A0A9P3GGM2_9APHY|nr:hypothetical protein PsYK624_107510 [Phanerochaete sordida]
MAGLRRCLGYVFMSKRRAWHCRVRLPVPVTGPRTQFPRHVSLLLSHLSNAPGVQAVMNLVACVERPACNERSHADSIGKTTTRSFAVRVNQRIPSSKNVQ